jgi:Mg2+-importing ATPase
MANCILSAAKIEPKPALGYNESKLFMPELKKLNYYAALPAPKVLAALKVTDQGLTNEAAAARLAEYGRNVISEQPELHVVLEFLSHFKNPLILVLLAASGISAWFGELTNFIIIAVMILASVTLDFIEEHSANQAAKKLIAKVRTTTTVIRHGRQQEISTSEVAVGDLIFLNSGDLVPADARLIAADDFFVNQSSLSGESFPQEKNEQVDSEPHESLLNLTNIVFMGSNVVSGTATAVVVKTGANSEFGKIAEKLIKPAVKSDFEIGIDKFGFFIMRIIIFLVLIIFLLNSVVHKQILESFMFALAIAFGITPELLPVIMSVTIARGSVRMAKKGVIVKKQAAIPNFGSMDVLCTDKTGTLTEAKITLVNYTDISGQASNDVLLHTYLNSYYQTGVKNPLDEAVINFKKIDIAKYKKFEEIPFDFVRKMMSIAVAGPAGKLLITKGAPEEVIKRCQFYRDGQKTAALSSIAEDKALAYYNRASADGYRVLAVASKPLAVVKAKYTKDDESALELLGFVAFLDPAKQGVKKILRQLAAMGVAVKVITGDNELVTQKICHEVGLDIKGVMLGQEAETMTDDALKIRAEAVTVFARFSPDDKNRVINALRSNKHVVGYLGDGINDAPSLLAADVGISVNNAVDVAKASADIVLTEKSLEALVQGIIEGRRAFANTMKYILMGLSSNFGNMFSVLGAVLFVPFLPMLPIQILLNNFIYDMSQVTIPTDNVDEDWLKRPRHWNLKYVKKFMYTFGPISSIFDILTYVIMLYVFRSGASVFQTAWFMESLATQTLVIHFIRTRQLPFVKSTASRWLLLSTFSAVVIGWLIPYTPLGAFFQFSPLPAKVLWAICGLVIIYLLLVEVAKRFFYRYDFGSKTV